MPRFDHLVVGSSPMMLIHAQALAATGDSVCVLERLNGIGGAWRSLTVGQGVEVEIASHVIEAFPGVYNLLSEAADVPFVPLEAQPMRVMPGGRHRPYFSRLMLAGTGAYMALGLLRAVLAREPNDILNFRIKLWGLLRYQWPYLLRRVPMEGPRDGFVDFMERLQTRARAAGVVFEICDVIAAKPLGDGWQVTGPGGDTHQAGRLHVTTSCGLQPDGTGGWRADTPQIEDRAAVVVDIAADDVGISQTYAAFWRDPKVSRISRIDRADPGTTDQRFLIELRQADLLQDPGLPDLLRSRLEAAHILRKGAVFVEVGPALCEAPLNTDQLPRGTLAPGFEAYYSNGNLAAGLAHWAVHQRPNR